MCRWENPPQATRAAHSRRVPSLAQHVLGHRGGPSPRRGIASMARPPGSSWPTIEPSSDPGCGPRRERPGCAHFRGQLVVRRPTLSTQFHCTDCPHVTSAPGILSSIQAHRQPHRRLTPCALHSAPGGPKPTHRSNRSTRRPPRRRARAPSPPGSRACPHVLLIGYAQPLPASGAAPGPTAGRLGVRSRPASTIRDAKRGDQGIAPGPRRGALGLGDEAA